MAPFISDPNVECDICDDTGWMQTYSYSNIEGTDLIPCQACERGRKIQQEHDDAWNKLTLWQKFWRVFLGL